MFCIRLLVFFRLFFQTRLALTLLWIVRFIVWSWCSPLADLLNWFSYKFTSLIHLFQKSSTTFQMCQPGFSFHLFFWDHDLGWSTLDEVFWVFRLPLMAMVRWFRSNFLSHLTNNPCQDPRKKFWPKVWFPRLIYHHIRWGWERRTGPVPP